MRKSAEHDRLRVHASIIPNTRELRRARGFNYVRRNLETWQLLIWPSAPYRR